MKLTYELVVLMKLHIYHIEIKIIKKKFCRELSFTSVIWTCDTFKDIFRNKMNSTTYLKKDGGFDSSEQSSFKMLSKYSDYNHEGITPPNSIFCATSMNG